MRRFALVILALSLIALAACSSEPLPTEKSCGEGEVWQTYRGRSQCWSTCEITDDCNRFSVCRGNICVPETYLGDAGGSSGCPEGEESVLVDGQRICAVACQTQSQCSAARTCTTGYCIPKSGDNGMGMGDAG